MAHAATSPFTQLSTVPLSRADGPEMSLDPSARIPLFHVIAKTANGKIHIKIVVSIIFSYDPSIKGLILF